MNGIKEIKKMNKEADIGITETYEYRQCGDCKHRWGQTTKKPSPCKSCEQNTPTNFEEE